MKTKKLRLSKTVWFNIFMTIVGAALFLEDFPGLPEWVPLVSSLVHGIGNLILRIWFTDSAIG